MKDRYLVDWLKGKEFEYPHFDDLDEAIACFHQRVAVGCDPVVLYDRLTKTVIEVNA